MKKHAHYVHICIKMLMQEELSSIRVKFEESEQKLLSSTTAYQSLKESFEKETEQLRTKVRQHNNSFKFNIHCRQNGLVFCMV